MRILVTGTEGQVARALVERGSASGCAVQTIGRPRLDLAGDPALIVAAIEAAGADVIVSAAAYTAVDLAEQERDLAFAINERGAAAVARAAARLGVPLVHLSTDYVFDGRKAGAYDEGDEPCPTSVYGASKLAGERAVLNEHSDSAVLRTAWVYSPWGRNFVRTMLHLARQRDEVSVVADQIGSPTSALDIADGVLRVAANLVRSRDPRQRGLFHMAAAGHATWAGFAAAIFEASRRLGGPTAAVRPISSADYPTAAKRPANSRLDSSRLAELHHVRLPDWQASLQGVVGRLLEEGEFGPIKAER